MHHHLGLPLQTICLITDLGQDDLTEISLYAAIAFQSSFIIITELDENGLLTNSAKLNDDHVTGYCKQKQNMNSFKGHMK